MKFILNNTYPINLKIKLLVALIIIIFLHVVELELQQTIK